MSYSIIIQNTLLEGSDSKMRYVLSEKEKKSIDLLADVKDNEIVLNSTKVFGRGIEFVLRYLRLSRDPDKQRIPPKPLPHSYLQDAIFGVDSYIIDDFMTSPNEWFTAKRNAIVGDDDVEPTELHIANMTEIINTVHYLGMSVLRQKLSALLAIILRKLPYNTDLIKCFKQIYLSQ